MAYKDLSVKERHAIIRAGVANGVHRLSDIEAQYNAFTDKSKHPDYDIEAYVRENPNAVFTHPENVHFIDKYKLPNHPTFSDESVYATQQTPAGHWNTQAETFEPSTYMLDTYGSTPTIERLRRDDPDYTAVYNGGVLLPDVEVRPYAEGGGIHIKHPGRLTALKERTGKTEAELWAEGRADVRKMITFAQNARKWKHEDGGYLGHRFTDGGPKYKQSPEAYYDPQSDTVFAPDSIGEFYHHEMFHARPNVEYLQRIAPYYENLNDSVLTSMGADLLFVTRNGDPGQYYSPEEISARVTASLQALKKAGITSVSKDFITKSRRDENQYGDNYRDLLHMYNDDILFDLFNQYAQGGSIHIAPSKRGTFTAAATKHGKSVQAFASQVLANKENYSPAMVKKANFARNAAKWHSTGGPLYPFSFTKPIPAVRYDKGGKKTPSKKQIVAAAWENENPTNRGLMSNGMYRQYSDPSGKGMNVGPGLLVGATVPNKKAYTRQELDNAAYKFSMEGLASIGDAYNEKYGTEKFPTPFDTVSVTPKLLMLDTRYQNGRLPIGSWPSLYQAVADGNWAEALKQSRSTYTKDGVKYYDNDRVRRRAESLFPGMFNVTFLPNSPVYPVVKKK